MGIRIHKCLGYGIEIPNDKWNDIINRGPENNDFYTENMEGYEDYLDSLIEKSPNNRDLSLEKMLLYDDSTKKITPSDIVCNIEYNDKVTMVAIPPDRAKEWSRFDDDIDYYEHSQSTPSKEFTTPKFQWLDYSIFPYEGYMNATTGDKVGFENRSVINDLELIIDNYDKDSGKYKIVKEAINKSATKAGFSSYDDYKENCTPLVPSTVVNAMNYFEIFNHPYDMINLKAKPIIATWWE